MFQVSWTEPSSFPVFDAMIQKRGRSLWRWHVYAEPNRPIMDGCARSRAEANYRARAALFQLLATRPSPPRTRRRCPDPS